MKKYIFLLLILLQTHLVYAQNENIYMSVAMPSNSILDNNTKSILKNGLLQIISAQGVAGTETGAIAIVPEIDVINSNTIDGGMRRIITVDLGVTFTVRNIITNTVFNTIQISASGEGYSENDANRAAINKIDFSTAEFAQFLTLAKAQITDYYKTNTTALIAKANTLATQQQFDEALALLSAYPESLSGYSQVSAAITAIFSQCQTQYCSQILLSAQAAYSQQNYSEAAYLVAMIDAQSSCAPQAKVLMASIKKNMDKEYNDMVAMEKAEIQSNERIEKARIKAIDDIATEYFKRQADYVFFW